MKFFQLNISKLNEWSRFVKARLFGYFQGDIHAHLKNRVVPDNSANEPSLSKRIWDCISWVDFKKSEGVKNCPNFVHVVCTFLFIARTCLKFVTRRSEWKLLYWDDFTEKTYRPTILSLFYVILMLRQHKQKFSRVPKF